MEETLKTARFVHRIMMGICATLFAFAVTAAASYDYVGAFRVLQTVSRQLQAEHLAKYVGLFGRVSLDELEIRCRQSTELGHEDCEAFSGIIVDLGIGFLPFEEARKELVSRLGGAQGVKFLGVQFDRARVGWAGPLALAVILAYFLCYLEHVRACSMPGAYWDGIETPEIRSFPWILLFDSKLSCALSGGSILVLPCFASIVCCFLAQGNVSLAAAIVLSMIVGWTAFLAQKAAQAWREELRLRSTSGEGERTDTDT